MQTNLLDSIRSTADGLEAESILRACVHCGFCTATCPTYQLLGNELDSPRGRIYLIKEMLEGAAVTDKTMLHLDAASPAVRAKRRARPACSTAAWWISAAASQKKISSAH